MLGVPPSRLSIEKPNQHGVAFQITCHNLTISGRMTPRGRCPSINSDVGWAARKIPLSHLRTYNYHSVVVAAMMTAMMGNNHHLGH
jgi:hypothetical protein